MTAGQNNDSFRNLTSGFIFTPNGLKFRKILIEESDETT